MRAIHLANYFIAGCIASSFLGWIASLHPTSFRAIAFLAAAALVIWGLCWLLDYSVSNLLKITVSSLQAFLLAMLAAIAIGAGVFLCS
jgi:hypothetical protein